MSCRAIEPQRTRVSISRDRIGLPWLPAPSVAVGHFGPCDLWARPQSARNFKFCWAPFQRTPSSRSISCYDVRGTLRSRRGPRIYLNYRQTVRKRARDPDAGKENTDPKRTQCFAGRPRGVSKRRGGRVILQYVFKKRKCFRSGFPRGWTPETFSTDGLMSMNRFFSPKKWHRVPLANGVLGRMWPCEGNVREMVLHNDEHKKCKIPAVLIALAAWHWWE
ncbi:hypothetical protein B296_00048279 [Ensete ventricosum]|uniref:Uncharacterized protein n=1 Tax=Ensete ventricosum TaxID=4639 RepID=A0A426YCN2_ENSVE|nr:hypothetical protein B296_00048279 [Ensete ventricosum]